MKKKMISLLLVTVLLCALALQQPLSVHALTGVEFVSSESVEIGKTYVIVADGRYALTNRQEGPALHEYADGAETTLASAPVTLEDGAITSAVTEDMLWTVEASTAPDAYDGMEQYFLRDQDGRYLRRGSGSGGDGAQLLAEPELYTEKLRFNAFSFYPLGDGAFAMYANSERSYSSDRAYYLYGNETSFDSPSRRSRSSSDPFAFAGYDDCSAIRLYEAVGYEPCVHEYEPTVTEPTCTEQGYTTYTCTLCGRSYVSGYTDALRHDWPAQGTVTKEPTETERGVLTFACTRCGQTKDRPLAAGTEKAHKNEILFISDLHSGRNGENGYHNLRAMFRLLREYDDFIPEVVAGGGDYLESRTYDDVDWFHCFEVLHDIMYETSPDTVQVLTAGNHEWEWSLQSDEMLELLLGQPRVCHSYSSEDFEIFQIGAHTNDTGKEHFLEEDIAKLRSFLEAVDGSGKVIFIQTHWPLHYGFNSDQWRTVTNADLMIDLLNEFSDSLDICFVWGHNHNEDAERHKLYKRGDELQITKNESKQIEFTYINAGCLNERHAKEGAGPSDSYYGPGYLLEARIEDDTLVLDYGHITGAWPDPEEAQYDHNADLLYVEEIQEARESHHEIPLLHRGDCEHEYTAAVTAPTCTEAGYTTYTCAKCGAAYTGDGTPALGHDYAEIVTAPTCTEGGYTTRTCSRCGETVTDRETDARGHDWAKGTVTTEPTETTAGVMTFTCERCGEKKTQSIPPLSHEHSYTAVVTAPTCTQPGYTTYTCSCGDSYTGDETAALGHSYKAEESAPTCTEAGFTVYTCSRCGDTYKEDGASALGHDYQDGVCSRCGKADPDYRPPVDREALKAAVAEAETIDLSLYTGQSAEKVEQALAQAKILLDDPEASQEAVDAAVQAVGDAVAALEKKEDPIVGPGPREDLERAVREAEAVDTALYTEDSVKAFEEALAAAKAVLADPEATAEKIDSAAGRLKDAAAALEIAEPFRFEDVMDASKFYFDPVYWAFEARPQITNGVDETHFGPGQGCTRGQVVTFLWRAAGCPEPQNIQTAFTDLKPGGFYLKAVAWAVENEITKGMTASTFVPDDTCTRGQIVTFLWRANGCPDADNPSNPFADVPAGKFYTRAVLWAVEEDITKGVSDVSFAPDDTCTRGQVVTFLYRDRKT